MYERLCLVTLYETGKYTVMELAKEFKVSRKTVHKWLGRFVREGLVGLDERSRAPHRRPRATPAPVALAVVRAKEAHPTYGPA
ncbi:MAG: leucine zipper domain-containing protein, partial [Chloroflexota bacterium]|nr:leucine zipper domain-containing protein [Chloroflexota bacterium]